MPLYCLTFSNSNHEDTSSATCLPPWQTHVTELRQRFAAASRREQRQDAADNSSPSASTELANERTKREDVERQLLASEARVQGFNLLEREARVLREQKVWYTDKNNELKAAHAEMQQTTIEAVRIRDRLTDENASLKSVIETHANKRKRFHPDGASARQIALLRSVCDQYRNLALRAGLREVASEAVPRANAVSSSSVDRGRAHCASEIGKIGESMLQTFANAQVVDLSESDDGAVAESGAAALARQAAQLNGVRTQLRASAGCRDGGRDSRTDPPAARVVFSCASDKLASASGAGQVRKVFASLADLQEVHRAVL